MKELHKEDFASRGEPSVRFDKCGEIKINKAGVEHLRLKEIGIPFVCIFQGEDRECHNFFIKKSSSGWGLRSGPDGSLRFNCAAMSKLVIRETWESHVRPAGDTWNRPKAYTLHIALVPIDNENNKDVYALIRKKV